MTAELLNLLKSIYACDQKGIGEVAKQPKKNSEYAQIRVHLHFLSVTGLVRARNPTEEIDMTDKEQCTKTVLLFPRPRAPKLQAMCHPSKSAYLKDESRLA